MKINADDELAATATYVWNLDGRAYAFGIKNIWGSFQAAQHPFYQLSERIVSVRLQDLLRAGWIVPADRIREPAVSRGVPRQLYSMTKQGKAELIDYLRERFKRRDLVASQPLFATVMECLWSKADREFLRDIVTSRLDKIEEYLTAHATIPEFRKLPRYYAFGVLRGNLLNEAVYLDALKRRLELGSSPGTHRDKERTTSKSNKRKENLLKKEANPRDGQ